VGKKFVKTAKLLEKNALSRSMSKLWIIQKKLVHILSNQVNTLMNLIMMNGIRLSEGTLNQSLNGNTLNFTNGILNNVRKKQSTYKP
jgi:hypothetical protein